MSWDAFLIDDRGHEEGCWNYTHNTNRMIAAALDAAGQPVDVSWWRLLDGMSGAAGAEFLNVILTELERLPLHYQSMNPDSGWGDYRSLLDVLREMRNRVPEWPCVWSVCG